MVARIARFSLSSIIMGTKVVIRSMALFEVLLLCVFPATVLAAVGCTLNDPDRDVKRLFPQSTGYKTTFVTIQERGGDELKKKIEEKLGDKLDNIYEAVDVPYAYYTVLKGKKVVGRIHGVNQKGTYGGLQLILATDLAGKVVAFYYQKISSPEAKAFTDKKFTGQFIGLELHDFMRDTLDVKDPTRKSSQDFRATLRGLKKNLVLLNEFMLNSKNETIGNTK
jgi:hypothetical protein